MSAPRWIRMLLLVGLIAFGATEARAQVFRPRGNVKAGPIAKTSPQPASTPAGAKKATPATTPATASSKKSTRAASPRRGAAKKGRKGREGSDDTVIVDDDDEDVKITDD